MNFNLNSFLMGISTALDFAESEILQTNVFHSHRVSYLALRIAQKLGMSEEECYDLVSLAIMHDNGLTEAALNHDMMGDKSTFCQLEDIIEHCAIGERNVQNFPFLTNPQEVIFYHHEHYDGSGFFRKKGDQIPIMSRIIAFSDEMDAFFDLDDMRPEARAKAIQFAQKSAGGRHDPDVVAAFIELADDESLWNDFQKENIKDALCGSMSPFYVSMEWDEVFEIARVFARIIDAKTEHSHSHSGGLAEKIERMAYHYGIDSERKAKLKIAASLHDIGILAISKTILEKSDGLSQSEFETVKKHAYITHNILHNLDEFNEIGRWAFTHHEKLDGSGYPHGLSADDLGFEERLIACLDIYQALIEPRPYRDGLSHDEAINVMKEMASQHKIDGDITEDIDRVLGYSSRHA